MKQNGKGISSMEIFFYGKSKWLNDEVGFYLMPFNLCLMFQELCHPASALQLSYKPNHLTSLGLISLLPFSLPHKGYWNLWKQLLEC